MATVDLLITPRRAIIPATDEAVEAVRRVPAGTVLTAKTLQPRNVRHYRKYRAMLGFIAANHPIHDTPQKVADLLKIRAGFCDTVIGDGGEIFYKLKSTAFDACDQVTFDGFYKACIEDLFVYFYPDVPHERREDFLAEALRFSQ
jgi:hypothetical protein